MHEDNVIPFDIERKYNIYDDLSPDEFHTSDGITAPIFESMYFDSYGNLIGITKLGNEVLISKEK
ncbi:hypothetical protein [Jeotgalibaca dankookensis]|uniref:hypothetical protein n=1 Tax=Jeotgalibaca dankookensis TaxID=708126 RepID=UPI000782DC1C|nr:hypothetical protein [Jeotgalibaca dankookensis]